MRKLLCLLVISTQGRTGGPAFLVCTSEPGTLAPGPHTAIFARETREKLLMSNVFGASNLVAPQHDWRLTDGNATHCSR